MGYHHRPNGSTTGGVIARPGGVGDAGSRKQEPAITIIRHDVGERPVCTDHPDGKIYIDRRVRAAKSGLYAGLAFRCYRKGGKHLIKRATLPRSMTGENPTQTLPCVKCGQQHEHASGLLLAAGYTYAMFEQATAIVWLGRGGTYANVAQGLRIEADRARQATRTKCFGRPMLPRGSYQAKGRTTATKDYDYRSPRPRAPFSGPFSRSATTVASYLDVFGPPIIAAYTPDAMPRVIAIDSKPLKRRAWTATEKGAVVSVSAGERNGEVMVISDRTDANTKAVPILAALEGGKDSESWMRVFARLPDGDPPFWVVADLDSAIELAVHTYWKDAKLFRCEEHLRARMVLALIADGVPAQVTVAEATRLRVDVTKRDPIRKVRRGSIEKRRHPLHSLVGASLKSPADWQALKDGIERFVPKTKAKMLPASKTKLRTWIAENEALVMSQFDLKARYPEMPKSAGGVEGTLERIGTALGKRTEFFSNARRLELIIGLIRIESLGLANVVRYSEIIGETIAARGRVGFEWQEGRDVLGTSSIDDLIDDAVLAAAVSEADRQSGRYRQWRVEKTAKVDVQRAAAGLGPTLTGRFHRPNGPAAYHPIRKGDTVADIPEINRYWRADHNDGRLASEVGAGYGKPATWVCDEHPGHLHVWVRKVLDMSISRPSCPFCAGKRPCANTSLLGQYPVLAAEWAASNLLGPDEVMQGSNRTADWKCAVCKHEFAQRYLLSFAAPKDGLILDCFAGSATTAHAAMRLNKKDGGTRRFIMIEEGNPSDKYATTLTAERLRRDRTRTSHNCGSCS